METFSLSGLLVALFLPWLCGSIWVSWLLQRTGRCNGYIVLGQGYFVGILLVTLLIRLWDALGIPLHFWGIVGLTLAFSAVGVVLRGLEAAPSTRQRIPEYIPRWHLVVGLLLVALITWRHVTLAQELLLRPLFAWDAWMNWAPKAITWFHHRELVNFVSPEWWLTGGDAYTLGNRQANPYPIALPLIQLWSMLGAGTWDHSAIYLPWIIAPLALGLALFGHLRLASVPFLPAVIACYFLLSLPYLNAHAVLAGYADIWLAAAFSLAVCALYEWQQRRHWGYAVLWLLLALLCQQLKNPGLVLALIVVFFGVRVWVNLPSRVEWALWGLAGLVAVAALVFGFSLEVPYLGRLAVDAGTLEAGRLGRFELAYYPVEGAFIETLFVMINWHLLWFLLLPYALYSLYRGTVAGHGVPEFLPVLAALAFLVLVFSFTSQYIAAVNFVTLNRALLYPVPALIFCIFLSFRRREDLHWPTAL
jgi:hypothetical protein